MLLMGCVVCMAGMNLMNGVPRMVSMLLVACFTPFVVRFFKPWFFHLLNRLGQLKDTFPAKIVKGLAFSPLTDIRSFVQNYLLDEHLVDVKTLQAQLETLRHFETLAANVRERIAMLDHIEETDDIEAVVWHVREALSGPVR